MQDLQARQAALELELFNGMIESTPESWTQIVLTLTRLDTAGQEVPEDARRGMPDPARQNMPGAAGAGGNVTLELSSPEGHAPLGAEDGLVAAACKLDELWRGLPRALVKAEYVVTQAGDQWRYRSKYRYAAD